MSKETRKKNARQRILEAATHSFQTYGYARTTTQAIAEQAEVAEVTIFRHFKNKQMLFTAVVQEIGKEIAMDDLRSALTGDLNADLQLISQHILHFFLTQRKTIRMLMFESIHFPEMQDALAGNPREFIPFLSQILQSYMDAGQLKKADPLVVAQIFVSTLFGYAIGMESMGALLPSDLSAEDMSRQYIPIFLEGILVSNTQRE